MKLQREEELSLHNLLIRTIILKDLEYILTCLILLIESETTHIWKRLFRPQIVCCFINCISFNVFLFAGDDVKANGSELYFCKVFRY